MSLLDIAKTARNRSSVRKRTQEEIDLALAWTEDEVGLAQVAVALGKDVTNTSVYVFLSGCLREAVRNGDLVRRKP
jgi:hypothetical protein